MRTSHATDLLTAALDAHGGFERWQKFSAIEASIASGGLMVELKGQPQDPTPRRMTAALNHECLGLDCMARPSTKLLAYFKLGACHLAS